MSEIEEYGVEVAAFVMYYDSPANKMIPQMIAIALSPRPPSISIFIGQKIFQLLIQHMKM